MKTAIMFISIALIFIAAGCVQNYNQTINQTNHSAINNTNGTINTSNQTGVNFSIFNSTAFSISYPSNWTVNASQYVDVFFTGPTEEDFLSDSLSIASQNSTIQAALLDAKKKQPLLRDYKTLEEKNISINGKQALRYAYSWTDATYNLSITQVHVFVNAPGKIYSITATTPSIRYAEYEGMFNQSISSFRIR